VPVLDEDIPGRLLPCIMNICQKLWNIRSVMFVYYMMCNYHVLIFLGAKCEDMVLENRETIMVRELQQPVN